MYTDYDYSLKVGRIVFWVFVLIVIFGAYNLFFGLM